MHYQLSIAKQLIIIFRKFNFMQWIILASPPCEVYSRANTTGKVDDESLRKADELVRSVFLFQEHLEALVTIVENPSTGLLVNRDVSYYF